MKNGIHIQFCIFNNRDIKEIELEREIMYRKKKNADSQEKKKKIKR